MSLGEYRRRRRFGVTPEPEPGRRPPVGEERRRFVIQKHDATHIHYDLRLELERVLRSWACPKCLATPHYRKKLAVQVEDHPLDYIDFEGVIPEGEYGAGKVEIWDRGTYRTSRDPAAALEKGVLTVILEGEKVRGEFTLVHMKGKGRNWLVLLNKPDELDPDLAREGTAAPMPARVVPMQAYQAPAPFDSGEHLFQIKFDGIRALSYLDGGGSLSIRTRNQKEQAFRYPELANFGKMFLAREMVADGEIVALDERGISRFQLLQARMNLTGVREIKQAAATTPIRYYIFDLLYLNGRDLTGLPLARRLQILERIFIPHKYLRRTESIAGEGEAFFRAARELGLEGIMAKRRTAPYRQRRSRDWLKIKAVQEQEFVIGGFTEPRGSRTHFGALLLGYYDGGRLVYAGHVGSGFSEEALARLHALMLPLETAGTLFAAPPAADERTHWIRPELVAQVKFSEWTREGVLRQPVFLGLRQDKRARDVVREEKSIAV